MTAAPKRRETRRTHLDAAVVPVEQALLAKAADMESASALLREEEKRPDAAGTPWLAEDHIRAVALDTTASAFRAVAEEMHWVP